MTELEKHRKTWQGKTDEWLFNRLANELKDKVEEIHKLLAENEQLILSGVVKSFTAEQVGDMLANKFTTIEEAIHYFDNLK